MYLIVEPQKRAHSPWLAAGLASESKLDRIPYGRCEALPHGRTFPVACGGESSILSFLDRIYIT